MEDTVGGRRRTELDGLLRWSGLGVCLVAVQLSAVLGECGCNYSGRRLTPLLALK